MDKSVKNFLYKNPNLYERVYQKDNTALARSMFNKYLGRMPKSILDIGCGTGRDIGILSGDCSDCVGMDYLQDMIAYARKNYPDIKFMCDDMRSFRINKKFEAILAFGWVITYALTDDDLKKTLETFKAHSRKGTVLILELLNAASCMGRMPFKKNFKIDDKALKASGSAKYSFIREKQLLIRERVWEIPGSKPVTDYCKYRLLFPEELRHRLMEHGFNILEMNDNNLSKNGDLSGEILYVTARREH